MVMINGVKPGAKSELCKTCGAKMRRSEGTLICPNADRRDHKGEYYNGRA